MKDLKNYINESKTSMKYTVELAARAQGVQLLEVTEEEKNELLEEDLNEVYTDLVQDKEYEFALEGKYLTPEADRFCLTIKDENDDIVFESEDIDELLDRNKTYDDDGDVQVKGWEFTGVDDGIYLARVQTIRDCFYVGEFELTEPFDEEKLYMVQDITINDELLGDTVLPMGVLYYQRGEGYDVNRDEIQLDDEGCDEEQYYETHLYELTEGDWWNDLQE